LDKIDKDSPMLPETEKLVENIRHRTSAAKVDLEQAIKLFGDNDDKFLHDQIRLARFWLADVETDHLSMLKEDRFPPRTLADESLIVASAEIHLTDIALPMVAKICGWAKTYGSKFQAIG
jgi:hypothetical protein